MTTKMIQKGRDDPNTNSKLPLTGQASFLRKLGAIVKRNERVKEAANQSNTNMDFVRNLLGYKSSNTDTAANLPTTSAAASSMAPAFELVQQGQ